MAALQSAEFAGYFATPREPADPAVFRKIPFNFIATVAIADADTVSLVVIPAGWVVTGGFLQVTVSLATTATINVGHTDITSAGVIEATSDPNAYIDTIDIDGLTAVPFWDDLNADLPLAGGPISTSDTAVYCTFSSTGTPTTGTMVGYVDLFFPHTT